MLVPLVLAAAATFAAAPQDHPPLLRSVDFLKEREGTPDGKGVFVRRRGSDELEFVPWEDEETVNQVLRYIKFYKQGELYFSPGRFPVRQGFDVRGVKGLVIGGSPGTVLEFADAPEQIPVTLAPVEAGDTELRVDRPEQMHAGWRYQLYRPDKDNTRILEFEVARIDEGVVVLTRPVAFMPNIEEIPAGSRVLEEVNIFRVRKSDGIVIQNLVLDGRGRGPVRGHTLYCGILATGLYQAGERPTTLGMTVRGCTFRGFKGRGVCTYGWGDVRIENNGFYDIGAQAIEIDHYSSGHVIGNHVKGAEVGVMLNDAFESLVEGNVLEDCGIGVRVLRIFPDDWVNTGNVVSDNRIGPGCETGVAFDDDILDGPEGNVVRRNHFIGLDEDERIVRHDGNMLEANTFEP